MRVAVITDVHANLPALEAVLEATEAAGVEETWCLGDVVGYGVEPDACADLVRERCDVCLVGNHDLAVLGALDIASFSEAAAVAVEWTRANVARAHAGVPARAGAERRARRARPLPRLSARPGLGVRALQRAGRGGHGRPRRADRPDRPLSRRPLLHPARRRRRRETRGAQASDGALLDLSRGDWLVNPGSVGQPRDGDPRAAWLELDTEAETACFHRVPYDIDAGGGPDRGGGPAERLADRLHIGQ